MSLHEMLDMEGLPEALREMVEDYHLHLVDIRRMKDTSVFQTDVRQVFDFIRCSRSKQELYQLVKKDESFQMLEEDAYEVMTKYVKADELIQVKDDYRRDGKIDMCQALKELLADERMEGREEELRSIVLNMLMFKVGDEDIMKYTGCSMELLMSVREDM